jgi:putative ABC transport system permease protein
MFFASIKITFRNLLKNKLYSFINLAGLSIAIACCLFISIYVKDELTFDRFNKNADRIVLLQQFENNAVSGGKLASDFKQNFAQVEKAVRLKNVNPLIKSTENGYYEPNFYFADKEVFDVFTFPLVLGNAATALKEQYGVVLTEKMAIKYFGKENPLGKEFTYDGKATLHVTGVMKDLPDNTHLKIDFLANYENANELVGWDVTNNYWGGSSWTYLLLAPNSNIASIESNFPAYLKKLNDPNAAGVWKLKLIPLDEVYLKTSLIDSSPITYVYVFSLIGLLILALASFNYINLATAWASARAKEVGVRKVMGSSKKQLRWQFIGEAGLFISVSLFVAVVMVFALLPALNHLLQKNYSLWSITDVKTMFWIAAGIVGLSLASGAYPAFVMASYRAVVVLKGEISTKAGSNWLRKTLVVLQFAVAVIMIVATLIANQQLKFVRNKNLGYQRTQMLTLDLRDATANNKELFKQKINNLSAVEAATIAYGLPGSGLLQGQKLVSDYLPPNAEDASIAMLTIDKDFLKTFNIRLIDGRMFDGLSAADKNTFLINEAALKYFNWSGIEGKQTGYYTYQYKPDGSYEEVPVRGNVVGVISDYNHANLKQGIQPTIYALNSGYESQMAIRLQSGAISSALKQIEKEWKQFFPDKPFEYSFMDDLFEKTYRSEMKTAKLFAIFSGLIIFISSLGLLGLIAYITNNRRKEIGIRKVLGATITNILYMLSKDFLKLVCIAFVIATPVAWWAMHEWLKDFAFRISISWWVFMVAGITALFIAVFAVGIQAIKAALSNPVKSLRTE